MLGRTRPTAAPFETGDVVFYFRKQGHQKKGYWRGPAVVIGRQGQNYWCGIGGHHVLVAPEHLRAVAEEDVASWRS